MLVWAGKCHLWVNMKARGIRVLEQSIAFSHRFCIALAAIVLAAETGNAQDFQRPLSSFLYGRSGFGLHSASVSTSYYTNNSGIGTSQGTGLALFDSDVLISGLASVGWNRSDERSHIGIEYSAGYNSFFRYSDFNSANHTVSMTFDREIARKWSITSGFAGTYSNFDQLLFAPSALREVASLPTSFDDLAHALMGTTFTSAQVGAMLTGAAIGDSPARFLLFSNRALTSSGNASLSYSHSQRTTITVSGSEARSQPISGTRYNALGDNVLANNILTSSTSIGLGVAATHSLTPRTTIGVNVLTDRVSSNVQDVYRTSTTAFFSRRMSQRWILQAHGGGGQIRSLRTSYELPSGFQYRGGGSIGYSGKGHTYLVAVERMFGDSYGVGAGSTMQVSATWNWTSRSRNWSLYATGMDQRLQERQPGNIRSWQATVGASRQLNRNLSCSVDYAYVTSGTINQTRGAERSGVRLVLTWSPEAGERSLH